jgi:predicted dinucleotide-binding enzyme
MWSSSKKNVDLTHFESKSSGLDSGAGLSGVSYGSSRITSSNESLETDNANSNSIAIIGSGDFGRALAKRMVQSGYTVNIGSRNPDRNSALVTKVGAHIMKVDEAVRLSNSNIIVLAVPNDFYDRQPFELFDGKILIDVSNRSTVYRKLELSQAEYLQSLLTKSTVVKAFNVISAYALETGGLQGSKEVFYAGDVHAAKEEVSGLIKSLGFSPVDKGNLRAAREIEDIPLQRFPLWKTPLLVSSILWGLLFILAFSKYQICWTVTWDSWKGWHWGRFETIPITTVNSTLAAHALALLSFCYMPGCIAAYIQLIRGSKYSRFPSWLDKWLKMRKQLGLLMLFSASVHMCMSVAVMSPTQYELAYGDPVEIIADVNKNFNYTAAEVVKGQKIKIFASEKMHWRGECFLAAGTWIPISQTKLHFKANKNSLIMFRSYAKKDVLKLKTEVHCFGYLLALADTKIIF